MSTQLTDAELARLEELHALAEELPWNPMADEKYIEAACNAVPALVVEVRRLRAELEQVQHGMAAAYMAGSVDARKEAEAEVRRMREALNKEHRAWQCAEMRGDALEEENAALREMVEALEWFVECSDVCQWVNRGGYYRDAIREAYVTLESSREGIK